MKLHQTKPYTSQKKAFTLVEIIIVITILAILATIAFISFQNYYNTSRDSVRVSDIKIIYDGLSVYKIKTGKYPIPDAFIDISAGNNKLTHQGEIGKNIKSIISVSGKATDPKDHTNYIYAIDVKNQKGQLMTFLEKGTDIRHLSLLPQMYASSTDYSERPVYIYGDTLGIITDENKTPIQYTTGTGVNLLDDEYTNKELTTYIGGDVDDGGKSTSTGVALVTLIESSLSGSLSCGSRSYSGYTLTGLAHDETGTFTKENPISDGTQYLELTIKCINGSYDTINASETITSVQCTTSNYVPHNNSCVENKCSGSIPDNAHSTALTQNHLTSWTYNEPNSLCSFECDLNYTYDVGSNTCKANNRTESCSSIPNNASYNSVDTISQTWSGSVWLPSNTSIHEATTSTSECRFTCNSGYTYDAGSNTCVGNSCTTPTSGVHSGLTYSLTSQSVAHGGSATITSGNRAFGTSPANGTTSAQFTYSCTAGALSLTSTANNAGSCGTGYTFNNNYSSPACSANCPAGMNLEGSVCRSSVRPKNTFYNAYYDCVNNFGTTLIGSNTYDSNVYWRSFSTGQVNYMCGGGSVSCHPDVFPPTSLGSQCKTLTGTMTTIFQSHHTSKSCTPAYDGSAYYQCYKSL